MLHTTVKFETKSLARYKTLQKAHYSSRAAKWRQQLLKPTVLDSIKRTHHTYHKQSQQHKQFALQSVGCWIVNMDQLRDSISILTTHSAQCGRKCTLEGETMHSGLAVIMQASCVKSGQVFSIRTSPHREISNGKQQTFNFGCSSWGDGDWRQVDTLELYACNDGSPWHEQAAVFSHRRIPWERNATAPCLFNAAGGWGREAACNCHEQFPPRSPQHYCSCIWRLVQTSSQALLQHQKRGCSDLWESHLEASVHRSEQQILCSLCCVRKQGQWGPTAQMLPQLIRQLSSHWKWHHCRGIQPVRTDVQTALHISHWWWWQFSDGDNSPSSALRDIHQEDWMCQSCLQSIPKINWRHLLKTTHSSVARVGWPRKPSNDYQLVPGLQLQNSATNNVWQLWHDLRNCLSHVFGVHSRSSVDLGTIRQSDTTPANNDIELQNTPPTSDAADTNIEQQIDTIIQEETDTTTPEDEHDVTHGRHSSLTPHVAPGLLNAIAKCADHIVSLAPQLITNQTSNLAESYMSIRCIMDGGKQFNHIQGGSFEHCCAAGLATQRGPGWMTSFWTAATKQEAGLVLSAHTSAKIRKLAADNKRKDTKEYKAQTKSTWAKSAASTDQHYGPNSQHDAVSPSELLQLCQEFHQRELNVTPQQRSYIEHHTKGQSEDSFGTISASSDSQLPTLAELQSGIPPHLLPTW